MFSKYTKKDPNEIFRLDFHSKSERIKYFTTSLISFVIFSIGFIFSLYVILISNFNIMLFVFLLPFLTFFFVLDKTSRFPKVLCYEDNLFFYKRVHGRYKPPYEIVKYNNVNKLNLDPIKSQMRVNITLYNGEFKEMIFPNVKQSEFEQLKRVIEQRKK